MNTIHMNTIHMKTMKPSSLLALCVASMLALTLSSCGGGGGSDDSFVGAASVSISLQPSEIDSGDRIELSAELSSVHENGIALKFRYPEGLKYVASSAFLLIETKEIDLTPTVNQSSTDNEIYLVFYIPQSSFRRGGKPYEGESGTVVLQLEGIDAISDGLVEVDPDVDDPDQPNATEFSIDSPEFDAQDKAYVTVVAQ